MANTHTLPPDSYYIFSEVDGKSLNLCDGTAVAREPVVVGNKQLLFQIQPVDPSNNIYTIWTDAYDRHVRGGDVHIYGTVDRKTPQKWIITYQPSRNAYNIETLNRRAWSDPGGNPNCERKLYLEPIWNPTGPQQTFRIQALV